MPGKRNDVEESGAFTRVISAWVLVFAILFWVTTPLLEDRSIRFSVRGSLGRDVACVGSKGECAEGAEMIRTAMRQEFDVRTGRAWRLVMHGLDGGDYPVSYERIGYELTSSKEQVEMIATFGKEGRAQVTMRMVFVSSQTAGDEEETEDAWRTTA